MQRSVEIVYQSPARNQYGAAGIASAHISVRAGAPRGGGRPIWPDCGAVLPWQSFALLFHLQLTARAYRHHKGRTVLLKLKATGARSLFCPRTARRWKSRSSTLAGGSIPEIPLTHDKPCEVGHPVLKLTHAGWARTKKRLRVNA